MIKDIHTGQPLEINTPACVRALSPVGAENPAAKVLRLLLSVKPEISIASLERKYGITAPSAEVKKINDEWGVPIIRKGHRSSAIVAASWFIEPTVDVEATGNKHVIGLVDSDILEVHPDYLPQAYQKLSYGLLLCF